MAHAQLKRKSQNFSLLCVKQRYVLCTVTLCPPFRNKYVSNVSAIFVDIKQTIDSMFLLNLKVNYPICVY